MKKYLIVVACLFFFSNSFAETFKLKSLQGEDKQINVDFEVDKGEIKIHLAQQNFTMQNVMAITGKIEVLENTFLKITYQTRVGSGIKQFLTSFYCINQNSLCQSLCIRSRYIESIINTYSGNADSSSLNMHSQMNVKLSLEARLKVRAEESYKYESQASPEKNFSYGTTTVLQFEKTMGIFYSEKKKLNGLFTLIDDDKKINRSLNGNFYFNKMRAHTYIFIDNVWMEIAKSNNKIVALSTFSKG